MPTLDSLEWRRLVESIRREKCILVLGPRAAVDPHQQQAAPLTAQLARRLARRLDDRKSNDLADPDNLTQVAQQYEREHSRLDLELDIQDFLGEFNGVTPAVHQDLAALPFPLCINLFFDHFMLNAFAGQDDKTPEFDYYNFRKVRDAALEPAARAPLVFNLFGDIDDAQSLIVTENDLLDFLVKVVSRDPPLQSNISGLLAPAEGYAFLFLGLGFQQWHTRILLHVLQMLGHTQPSLAVEDSSFFHHPDRPATALFFEVHHKIVFRELSVPEFAAELRHRFEPRPGVEPAADVAVAAGAPKVFLCYHGASRDEVLEWQTKLHRLGIDTWLDRQDLRGGDNWHQMIRDVLEKQTDYVLVLQTEAMVNAVRHYCKREIAIALDVQVEFNPFKFIIPARLDNCAGFDNLSHLQTQDLKTDADLERLAQMILEDWERRKKRQPPAPKA